MSNATTITNRSGQLSDARPPEVHRLPSRGRLGKLQPPSAVFRDLGPNWYASIMGTGIVANAAILLPAHAPGLHSFALGVWMLAAALLVGLTLATAAHWLLYPEIARGHHRDLAMAPFYGAPPMAMLTVGAGALLVGRDLIGLPAAITVDEILWTLGTLTGLASTIAIPYLMFTRFELERENTLATWLMPIVPPMVSAATGAALIAHLPAGQDRLAMLLCCYAMFGISLLASLATITLLWGRLAPHRPVPPPVLADLVELHLPGRHARHRHIGARAAHARQLPHLDQRCPVRTADWRLAHRRHRHRPRIAPRPAVPTRPNPNPNTPRHPRDELMRKRAERACGSTRRCEAGHRRRRLDGERALIPMLGVMATRAGHKIAIYEEKLHG
jgi:hypothetical protein